MNEDKALIVLDATILSRNLIKYALRSTSQSEPWNRNTAIKPGDKLKDVSTFRFPIDAPTKAVTSHACVIQFAAMIKNTAMGVKWETSVVGKQGPGHGQARDQIRDRGRSCLRGRDTVFDRAHGLIFCAGPVHVRIATRMLKETGVALGRSIPCHCAVLRASPLPVLCNSQSLHEPYVLAQTPPKQPSLQMPSRRRPQMLNNRDA